MSILQKVRLVCSPMLPRWYVGTCGSCSCSVKLYVYVFCFACADARAVRPYMHSSRLSRLFMHQYGRDKHVGTHGSCVRSGFLFADASLQAISTKGSCKLFLADSAIVIHQIACQFSCKTHRKRVLLRNKNPFSRNKCKDFPL